MSGYGFCFVTKYTIAAFTTNATKSIVPTKTKSSFAYPPIASNPASATLVATSPNIPNGANFIINLTILVMPSLISLNIFLVSIEECLRAIPVPIAHVSNPYIISARYSVNWIIYHLKY